jgi:hypothetical protein
MNYDALNALEELIYNQMSDLYGRVPNNLNTAVREIIRELQHIHAALQEE